MGIKIKVRIVMDYNPSYKKRIHEPTLMIDPEEVSGQMSIVILIARPLLLF